MKICDDCVRIIQGSLELETVCKKCDGILYASMHLALAQGGGARGEEGGKGGRGGHKA